MARLPRSQNDVAKESSKTGAKDKWDLTSRSSRAIYATPLPSVVGLPIRAAWSGGLDKPCRMLRETGGKLENVTGCIVKRNKVTTGFTQLSSFKLTPASEAGLEERICIIVDLFRAAPASDIRKLIRFNGFASGWRTCVLDECDQRRPRSYINSAPAGL